MTGAVGARPETRGTPAATRTGSTAAPRRTGMDLLRGIAVVAVVVLHVEMNGASPEEVRLVNDMAAPFRMAVLFFLSGVLLPVSLSRPAWPYLRGKIAGLVWPTLVFSLVIALALPRVELSVLVDPTWWLGAGHTWFLAVLFVLYVLALPLRRVPAGVLAVGLLAGHALVLQVWPDLTGLDARLYQITWFGFFFFAGAAAAGMLRTRGVPAWIGLPAGIVALWWSHENAVAAEHRVHYASTDIGAAVMPLLFVAFALWAADLLPRIAPVRALEWVGRHSVVPYLVHWPLVWVLLPLDGPGAEDSWTRFGAELALVLGLSLAAAALRPWTGWLYRFPAPMRGRTVAQSTVGQA